MCCSVLQYVAVCCSDVIAHVDAVDVPLHLSVLRCVAVRRVCCRVLQGVAGCCSEAVAHLGAVDVPLHLSVI